MSTTETDVVSKCCAGAAFGNDAIGFIRVRKRSLKGGHREWREYRARKGILATTSSSFDLVRAVRVNGKPRHMFVLGLGSQKDRQHTDQHFWYYAIYRLQRHGLAPEQRLRLIAEMVRKGARLPTIEECQNPGWSWIGDTLREIIPVIEASLPNGSSTSHLVTTTTAA